MNKLYVLITERDLPDSEAYKNGGAIIFETYTAKAHLYNAIKHAHSLGDRYGKTWIGEVTVLTMEEAGNKCQE